MYDIERIGKMIFDVEKEFNNLNEFNLNEENLSDSEAVYASSMAMLSIVTRTINIAEEIVLKNEWGMPNNYGELFLVLNKNGIIGKEIANEMDELVNKRNVIAHYYFDISPKEILKIKKDIYSVKSFLEKIKNLISKEGKR
jgi:uncharacterized protein YutE (UPF0331/DUF86 family)